jgi:ATP/ADP translocase
MEKQRLPNDTLILVMGILSIIGCCFYGIPGIIFGIVAIVLGSKATKLYKAEPDRYEGYGNVQAGKIMGIIGIVLAVIFVIMIIVMISMFGWDAMMDEELMRQRLEEMQQQ